MLMQLTKDLGANLVDAIKTTVVQNLRSMTTWVLRKNEESPFTIMMSGKRGRRIDALIPAR